MAIIFVLVNQNNLEGLEHVPLFVFFNHLDHQCDRTVEVYETVVEPKLSVQNRNKPIRCVFTIQIKPYRDDWLVFIRFTKFKVGSLSEDRRQCLNGYIQIVDGYYSANHSNSGKYLQLIIICSNCQLLFLYHLLLLILPLLLIVDILKKID